MHSIAKSAYLTVLFQSFYAFFQIRRVKKAVLIEENSVHCLMTDGVNIEKMWEMDDVLDINKMTSNNVHDMAR